MLAAPALSDASETLRGARHATFEARHRSDSDSYTKLVPASVADVLAVDGGEQHPHPSALH
jgi:hypothetical protein